MLSYVEFYRPSYFLLENVIGLLQYPLMGRMIGRAFVAGAGIKMGVVKFIVRSLTCLGFVGFLVHSWWCGCTSDYFL
jgi:DNA (cytosine-5)-methyltransferase 1